MVGMGGTIRGAAERVLNDRATLVWYLWEGNDKLSGEWALPSKLALLQIQPEPPRIRVPLPAMPGYQAADGSRTEFRPELAWWGGPPDQQSPL